MTDFCVLILYPATLLNVFISSISFCLFFGFLVFLAESGFSTYKIISSVNRDDFTSSFPTWMPFISFSCPDHLARTSNTMLNRRGKREHLRLIPDLTGKALSFSIENDISCGFFI